MLTYSSSASLYLFVSWLSIFFWLLNLNAKTLVFLFLFSSLLFPSLCFCRINKMVQRKDNNLAKYYPKYPAMPMNCSITARNLRKCDLGGVIFGCKHNTMSECLTKQMFGTHDDLIRFRINDKGGSSILLAAWVFNQEIVYLYDLIFQVLFSNDLSL